MLQEIQKYIQGEFIYIPQQDGSRKHWGEKSGQREQLARRNKDIREKFKLGMSIDRPTKKFHLSHDTIKKICIRINVKARQLSHTAEPYCV
ncbi:CD3324 family protein [Paenibacillus sp. 481]|uniref:CD3324 family protein n=1 Tax=Paenibacillus sp. 481 TaxID=2835869 RepID=UPI001E5AF7B5|nr:CD3324 family protein [Paenibacillus sp. 481]